MRYRGQSDFDHSRSSKVGILITNLGTPASPDRKSLRKYLKQFLSDPRVVEIPRAIWWFILNGIILNTRPSASARLYRSVWTDVGSPLMFHTKAQSNELSKLLAQRLFNTERLENTGLVVDFAMRYGEPSIPSKMREMQDAGIDKLLVLPLYPQYSGSTTGSTFDAIAEEFKGTRWIPEFRFVNKYHDNPDYISACAQAIKSHWQNNGRNQLLLLSYHGVPKMYLDKGDPYHCHCHKTSRLIAESLELQEGEYLTTFQSRFGRAEWLQPYTDKTLLALPDQNITSVDLFCPGFAADCLETLEEIAVENKRYFIDAGGSSYSYIPALNASAEHIGMFANLVEQTIADWIEDLTDVDPEADGIEKNRQWESVEKIRQGLKALPY